MARHNLFTCAVMVVNCQDLDAGAPVRPMGPEPAGAHSAGRPLLAPLQGARLTVSGPKHRHATDRDVLVTLAALAPERFDPAHLNWLPLKPRTRVQGMPCWQMLYKRLCPVLLWLMESYLRGRSACPPPGRGPGSTAAELPRHALVKGRVGVTVG